MPILFIVTAAILSAISRGIISVIDRYQMGIRHESSIKINFYNNLFTILLTTLILGCLKLGTNLTLPQVQLGRVFLYSLIVQAVAYGYSFVFQRLTVTNSIVVGKLSDFLIPLAIFLTTGYLNWKSYAISIITTVIVCLLLTLDRNYIGIMRHHVMIGALVITPLLVIQAALSPVLTSVYRNPQELLFFTIYTLYIRFFITVVLYLVKRPQHDSSEKTVHTEPNTITKEIKAKLIGIFFSRAILTIAAQVTFTLATSSIYSSVAWVFLNMTSLYGLFLSQLILKERPSKLENVVLISVTLIGLLRVVL